ncbi:YidC/Oxa1 family membrane protein insertase [Solobacterium sp.]|mgnify:FL=1|jgi:membrane protein oxaA 2|uniref:YidC/Oxa1 family membrane protein insertase n=1 Tax=Solobacterium sp. TaxID=2060878 RepID=UPI001CAE04BF|nr:YidC/Oxa1 family membrane protein insertase [Solobacterium sp.]MBF1071683.1 membrane protein insertase YidC [Solobacterium sp.]MBF1084055.1 membrane protein insertase YidC [Solobacterium sp.]MBF1100483.1 membrane protein insertase YidC [Solobacterium sp.]MBF1107294.1 membrane protein insertase YidC [Solobacterium sp.]MBF1112713.1 membrane protein insertase YidC [Solobacterium sp.]
MKFTPRTKKLLALMAIVTIVVTATGCTAPKDANGHIILISESTTFGEIFQTENWFNALFVWPLSWVLNKLAPVITVGGAIAVVTAVVNGLLAVFTLKSQMGMQRMQMLQPELNKIQRKYEGRDDQASKMRMAQEQQQLMNKYNVNPGSMMLVQFIQLPIIMAMFMAIQRAEAVVNGTFLGMNLQVKPSEAFGLLFKGDLSGLPYIILFLLMAVTQVILVLLPMYFQKKKAAAEAEKHHRKPEPTNNQNVMMQMYMIVMVLAFGLMWQSGMSLFWFIRNIVDIIKTIIVQNIMENNSQKEGLR